jgi:ATP-dependent RNA helicase DeaD
MSDPVPFLDQALRAELKPALAELGFTQPTPVQQACLEAGLGTDLLVQARTGSGKTLAFGLPLLGRVQGEDRLPQALVLAPTRELALQIAKALSPLTKAIDARCVALTGGAEIGPQLKALHSPRGAQIVVGTPGRVLDHLERGSLVTKKVSVVVLDEGDHLLDLGFKDELDAILEKTKTRERTLLFSATIPREIDELARKHMHEPRRLMVDTVKTAHVDIEHQAYAVPDEARVEALANLILFEQPERTLVFCATRIAARSLSERLPLLGISAGLISGELEQAARNRALDAYREGICHVLVATDVAARGIDVPATTHVIHYNLAETAEAYVHRSGRTGRAGRKGLAISLVSMRERSRFAGLVRPSGVKVRWRELPGPGDILRRRIEVLAERVLAADAPEPGAHALEHAHRIANAKPLDATSLARLLDAAAAQEGPPGFDVALALREEAKRPRPAWKPRPHGHHGPHGRGPRRRPG